MYIRRKVFSLLQDETGEERYFSTTEFEINQREFAEKEDKKPKKKRRPLEDVKSHRGLGRSLIVGLPSGFGGAVGAFLGKKKADKLDAEGKSDKEILKGATKHAAAAGAGIGAGLVGANIVGSSIMAPKGMKKAAIVGSLAPLAAATGFGALGGYLGAKKNTKTRLEKRKYRKIDDDDEE